MTYEYLCTSCQHGWEAEQSISAAPLTTCPRCHAESAKRQVSGGAGFILKGGGWYADLYGAPKKAAAEGASESSGKSDAAAGESKKGDSSSSGAPKDAAKSDATTKGSTATPSTTKGSTESSTA